MADEVAEGRESTFKAGRDCQVDDELAEIGAIELLGKIGDVEDVEKGEADGLTRGLDNGDGIFVVAVDGANNAGDSAEVVTGSEVDDVGRDR